MSYDNRVSKSICDQNSVDYINTILNNLRSRQEREDSFTDVSIAIASAVTSYARIIITKHKLDILTRGGSVYYSDTDSLVTDMPLKQDLIGKDLGQFKLEHDIDRAYFITSKTYCLVLKYGSLIIKAKGVNDSTLDESSFIELYKGNNIDSGRFETKEILLRVMLI